MNRLLIMIACCTLISAACSKSKDKPDCLVTKINQPTGDEYTLSYDEQGRLKSVNYGNNSIANITYEANKIISLTTSGSGYYYKRTYTLNAAGLVTQLKTEYDAAGNSWQTRVYQYQGNQLSKMTLTESNSAPSERSFVWSNGNLIKETITGTGYSQVLVFEYYTDRPYQAGSSAEEVIVIAQSKNLLKKLTSTYTENNSPWTEETGYSYEFDSDGKIISMTEKDELNSNSPPLTYRYEYKCN